MTIDEEREKFELWADGEARLATVHVPGQKDVYASPTTQVAWLAWRAAALEQDQTTFRCYHCKETFKAGVDAENHFGLYQDSEPACRIKAAGEFALLGALRSAEDQLARYRAEDSDVLRAMHAMSSDHQQALRREEEKGYARGIADNATDTRRYRLIREARVGTHGHCEIWSVAYDKNRLDEALDAMLKELGQ